MPASENPFALPNMPVRTADGESAGRIGGLLVDEQQDILARLDPETGPARVIPPENLRIEGDIVVIVDGVMPGDLPEFDRARHHPLGQRIDP